MVREEADEAGLRALAERVHDFAMAESVKAAVCPDDQAGAITALVHALAIAVADVARINGPPPAEWVDHLADIAGQQVLEAVPQWVSYRGRPGARVQH